MAKKTLSVTDIVILVLMSAGILAGMLGLFGLLDGLREIAAAGGVTVAVAVSGLVLILAARASLRGAAARPPKTAVTAQKSATEATALRRILVGVPVQGTVDLALRATGAAVAPRALDTQALLITLMRADSAGQWYRLWLRAGGLETITGRVVLDPVDYAAATWEGIPLTYACARALDIAARLSQRYDIWPLTVGMVSIGLVADPSAGAAQALGTADRDEVLEILQADVLGVRLTGIEHILRQVLAETGVHS
ncbi:hypothetical protein [Nocardia concava]|uniref:hypothetical protein n=1 Tax=Nocardia concava TaxID=257281 RepID=UPI0002ED58CB|nr:hypothetical protein [Nocardia concava]